MIRVNASTIWNDKSQAVIAGLRWVAAPPFRGRRRHRALKSLVESWEASGFLQMKAEDGVAAWGFDDFDKEINTEERPRKCFSLAAGFCRLVKKPHAVLYWRIRGGSAEGQVALVVVEHGLPVIDEVLGDESAVRILGSYQTRKSGGQNFWMVSNDPSFAGPDQSVTEDSAYMRSVAAEAQRIGQIPADVYSLGMLLGGVLLAAGAWFGNQTYSEMQEDSRRQAMMKSSDDTAAYQGMLNSRMRAIGISSSNAIVLLEAVYQEPFETAGWALSEVRCAQNVCQLAYASKGGSVEHIVGVLTKESGYELVGQPKPASVVFRKQMGVASSAISSPAEFMKSEALSVMLEKDQSLWRAAGIDATVASSGVRWPEGFTKTVKGGQVNRFALTLSGGPLIVEEFLSQYTESVYWDSLVLRISSDLNTRFFTIDMKGAFYGS